MPFRARMRKALGRQSVSQEGTDLTQTKSKKENKPKQPDNVYKFGEVMPKPKYRGPVNQEHQERLRAFSFASAFGRRNSEQSQYSPMGSRLPSRKNSLLDRFSFAKSRRHSSVDRAVNESGDGDGDVRNVDLSRQQTQDNVPRAKAAHDENIDPLQQTETITNDNLDGRMNGHANGSAYSKPFTDDELTRAMTKATLKQSNLEKI